MPALILARGSEGLWVGLALTVAPLIALVAPGGAEPAQRDAGARFRRAVLLAVAGISIWANIGLAADVAAWRGAPRWQGIAVAVIAGWLFAGWRGGARWLGVLWLAGLVGMSATLLELAREAGAGPLAAWERVASQSAFRFHRRQLLGDDGPGPRRGRRPCADGLRRGASRDGAVRRPAPRALRGWRARHRAGVDPCARPVRHAARRRSARGRDGAAPALRTGQARAGRAGIGPGVVRVAARRWLAAARALPHAGGGWRGLAPRGHAAANEPARRARGRRGPGGGLCMGAGLGDLRHARRARRVPRRRHHRAPRRCPDAEPGTAAMDGGAASAAARRGPRELRRVQHRAARAAGAAVCRRRRDAATALGTGVSGRR